MGKRFFFRLIRLFCKNGGFCLFKNVIYIQTNSKYIENNYVNTNDDLKEDNDE